MSPSDTGLRDRFRGCLLGLAVGDALGAKFEAQSPRDLPQALGPAQPAGGRLADVLCRMHRPRRDEHLLASLRMLDFTGDLEIASTNRNEKPAH